MVLSAIRKSVVVVVVVAVAVIVVVAATREAPSLFQSLPYG